MKNTIIAILYGIGFCISQSFVKALLGFFITNLRHASDVNLEGAILYAIMRILFTAVPYLLLFIITFILTNKIKPSFLSLGLNIAIISYFTVVGFLKEDPASFIFASIVTSLIFVLVDLRVNCLRLLKTI